MIEFRRWEVWLAKVVFEDQPDIVKIRPVVIIDTEKYEGVYVLSYKVTGQPPRDNCFGEYVLQKWQECGLDCPSTVRLSKKLLVPEGDFVRRLGKLDKTDIFAIREVLRR